MALLEPGDGVRVKLVRAERVLPDDIYWGTQHWPGSSPQKGFILEAEGVPVPQGAVPVGHDKVRIGPFLINVGELVLIQDLSSR